MQAITRGAAAITSDVCQFFIRLLPLLCHHRATLHGDIVRILLQIAWTCTPRTRIESAARGAMAALLLRTPGPTMCCLIRSQRVELDITRATSLGLEWQRLTTREASHLPLSIDQWENTPPPDATFIGPILDYYAWGPDVLDPAASMLNGTRDICSYNANDLRARHSSGALASFLTSVKADVICMQELKMAWTPSSTVVASITVRCSRSIVRYFLHRC